MAQRLSDKVARALIPPPSGNRVEYDDVVKGFGCRITAKGARSFILNYRTQDGIERRLTIGSFPDWGVAAARDKAAELKRRVDDGGDPMAERHAVRVAPTMADLAERYMAEVTKGKVTLENERGLIRQWIGPRLGNLRVATVEREDIEKLHKEITKGTPRRANLAVALLSHMFTKAIDWKMRVDNPARGIKRNKETQRKRYLKPAELERLMAALARHPSLASANAVRLLLLTGARRSEVLTATWDQFDFESGVWVKPVTKQGEPHQIPLSAPARQLLSEMHAKSNDEALFPGRNGLEHQQSLKRFWASICKAAEIEGVRVHDLRHSHASILVSAGLSLPTIGALLGHRNVSTTNRYAHLMDDPLRAAVERVGSVIANAGTVTENVVPMRRA